MQRYKAAFLIPKSANKVLGDDGWLFVTQDRVPIEALTIMLNKFSLKKLEDYERVSVYAGDGMKVNVIHDDKDMIEQVYFQLFEREVEELRVLLAVQVFKELEFFEP